LGENVSTGDSNVEGLNLADLTITFVERKERGVASRHKKMGRTEKAEEMAHN